MAQDNHRWHYNSAIAAGQVRRNRPPAAGRMEQFCIRRAASMLSNARYAAGRAATTTLSAQSPDKPMGVVS